MSQNAKGERPFDASASYTTKGLAAVLALLSPLLLDPWLEVLLGLAGGGILAGGAMLCSRRAIGLGTVILLAAVVYAAYGGPSVPRTNLLLCTLATLLAWDSGRYGIQVGDQLGRAATTLQIELAHALSSLLVGVAGIAVGYGTFLLVDTSDSVVALLSVLFGVTVLALCVFSFDLFGSRP